MKKKVVKTYDLNKGINVPENIDIIFLSDDEILVIYPDGPSFILLTEIELKAFEKLRRGYNLKQVINYLNEIVGDPKYVQELIRRLLIKIDITNFYEGYKAPEKRMTFELTFNITERCNLNCRHCFKNSKPYGNDLPIKIALKTIAEYSDMIDKGEVTFTGGEPLLHPEIDNIIQYAKEQEHRVTLFTNATLIDKHAKVLDYIDEIQFSLDGASPAVNDYIRGPGVFNKVIQAIKTVYTYRHLRILLNITVMPFNIYDIKKNLIKLLNRIDPERRINLILSPCLTAGRNIHGEYTSTHYDIIVSLHDLLEQLWTHGYNRPKEYAKPYRKTKCAYGDALIIEADGNVRPCPLPSSPIVGNIHEESLKEIYQRAQRLAQKLLVYNMDLCTKCSLRFVCGGGCRIENLIKRGSELIPACNLKHKFYYYLVIRDSLGTIYRELGLT